jgi:hypothetical protein
MELWGLVTGMSAKDENRGTFNDMLLSRRNRKLRQTFNCPSYKVVLQHLQIALAKRAFRD